MDKNNNPAVQVNANHYDFQTYTDLPRWTSYWHQITETLALAPKSALIVGLGDRIVYEVLAGMGGGVNFIPSISIKIYTPILKEMWPI